MAVVSLHKSLWFMGMSPDTFFKLAGNSSIECCSISVRNDIYIACFGHCRVNLRIGGVLWEALFVFSGACSRFFTPHSRCSE